MCEWGIQLKIVSIGNGNSFWKLWLYCFSTGWQAGFRTVFPHVLLPQQLEASLYEGGFHTVVFCFNVYKGPLTSPKKLRQCIVLDS